LHLCLRSLAERKMLICESKGLELSTDCDARPKRELG
jgi:hypothetical protein